MACESVLESYKASIREELDLEDESLVELFASKTLARNGDIEDIIADWEAFSLKNNNLDSNKENFEKFFVGLTIRTKKQPATPRQQVIIQEPQKKPSISKLIKSK